MTDFAERIRQLRLEKELTQEELASKIKSIPKVSKTVISTWENGGSKPRINTLLELASLFGVTTDYLLGRSDIRRARVVTKKELQGFLPPEAMRIVEKEDIAFLVEEMPLEEETKKEIMELLKKKGYIK